MPSLITPLLHKRSPIARILRFCALLLFGAGMGLALSLLVLPPQ